MEDVQFDEAAKSTAANMPRRSAVQGLVGSLAGLVALGAAGAGAQERKKTPKKKSANKKKSAKQEAQARRRGAAAAQRGTLIRIRQQTDSASVPHNSHRTLVVSCPRAKNNERVFVVGGGYSHSTNNPAFVVNISAPAGPSGWAVEGHNTTGSTVNLGINAICAYFRR